MPKKTTRRKAEIPKDETKAARFVRVVTPRVIKAVKTISVVGYCAGSAYEYTPQQITQIVDVLLEAVERVNNQFEGKAKSEGTFEFKV